VDRAKSARIRHLALRWIMAQRGEPSAEFWSAVRFDVVSVVRGSAGFEVTHLAGAF
jgi:Holliday junction resolvase-like predicted endonuclease